MQALDLSPDDPDLYLTLGRNDALGRAPDAVAAYQRYLDLAPAGTSAGEIRGRFTAG